MRRLGVKFLDIASGSGYRSRLPILTYHRVLSTPDPLLPWDPDADSFRHHVQLIQKYCQPLLLSDAVRLLKEGNLPSRAICMTFDDGYSDNFEVALPILERLGVPATFFIATGYLNGGMMWNDKVIEAIRELPVGSHNLPGLGLVDVPALSERMPLTTNVIRKIRYMEPSARDEFASELMYFAKVPDVFGDTIMMSDSMVTRLRDTGMEIGAHTESHPILAVLDDTQARAEIEGSKDYLETLLKHEVTSFAYPNGRFGQDETDRDVEIVKSLGFTVGVTTDWGSASSNSNMHALPRLGLSQQSKWPLLIQIAKAYRLKDPNCGGLPHSVGSMAI